jgi:hypothetical protein
VGFASDALPDGAPVVLTRWDQDWLAQWRIDNDLNVAPIIHAIHAVSHA